MVTFSILEKLKRPTLRQRRMLRLTRRLMAACCTAIAAFATLQCVTASIVTQPVVVAARLIPRGARIGAEDVEIRQMPVSDGWDTALDAANQAAGGIAQTDIAAGQPLFGATVSRRPVAEPGQTVIDVRVTGTVDGIAAGDVMDLVSGAPCDASAGTTSSRDESAGGRSCVLARSATAMDAAHDDAMTGGTLITFALTPDEAISIINAQELGPIMAVTAQ